MARDVLIVEDDKRLLVQLGNLVQQDLGLEPFLAENADEALALLNEYPVKVLVTDQEMEGLKGTELVSAVRNSYTLPPKFIMLTAYARRFDVEVATGLGLFRFLGKDKAASQLTPVIQQALYAYDREAIAASTFAINQIVKRKRGWPRLYTEVTITLLRITSTVDTFVRDSEWRTESLAQRGVSSKREVTISRRVATSLESQIEREFVSSATLGMGPLIASLKVALQGKLRIAEKVTGSAELLLQGTETIEVKEVTDVTPDGRSLQSREYQAAPVYQRINCDLEVNCSCCRVAKQYHLSVDIPTDRIALRHVEHFDRGSDRILYTGFVNAALSPVGRSLHLFP